MPLPFITAETALVGASPFIASFIGAAVDRIPRGEQVLGGRSRCRCCAATLRPAQLVPLVSYVLLRGRCAHCATPIPAGLFAFECLYVVATAVSVLFAPRPLIGALLAWLLLALAWFDHAHRRLPLELNIVLCLAGLGIAYLWQGQVWNELAGVIAAFASAGLIAYGYEATRGHPGLGGGDVRLFAAAGAWVGVELVPALFFLSSVLALCGALYAGHRKAGDAIAFGPAIAAATWSLWLWKGLQ